MKTWSLVLTASAVANIALGAYWWSSHSQTEAAATATPTASAKRAALVVDERTWERLQGATEAASVAALREAGFPPEMVRAVVVAQLQERYAARRQAIIDQGKVEYWRYGSRASRFDPETRAALTALDREQEAEGRRLLGEDYASPAERAALKARFGDLSLEKAMELGHIVSDYSDLMQQTRDEANGFSLPEDSAKLKLLESEQRADLAKLLSPEELEAYDRRTSAAAGTVKRMLADMEVSEAEYLALYAAQKSYNETFPPATGTVYYSVEESRARQAARDKTLQDQLAVFANDPERQAQFKISSDNSYTMVKSLVNRLGLPATTTADVISYAQTTEKAVQAVMRDTTLTTAQRVEKMTALQSDALATLTPKLGSDGVDAYKRSAGYWLQNLEMNLQSMSKATTKR